MHSTHWQYDNTAKIQNKTDFQEVPKLYQFYKIFFFGIIPYLNDPWIPQAFVNWIFDYNWFSNNNRGTAHCSFTKRRIVRHISWRTDGHTHCATQGRTDCGDKLYARQTKRRTVWRTIWRANGQTDSVTPSWNNGQTNNEIRVKISLLRLPKKSTNKFNGFSFWKFTACRLLWGVWRLACSTLWGSCLVDKLLSPQSSLLLSSTLVFLQAVHFLGDDSFIRPDVNSSLSLNRPILA